jgi:hypothetical protein
MNPTLLIVVTAVVLLLPFLIRTFNDNPFVYGEETYLNYRLIDSINNQGFPQAHPGSALSYNFNLFHYVMAGLSWFFDVNLVGEWLPFVLGVLTFFFLIKSISMHVSKNKTFFMGLAILVSPVYIYVFTSFTKYSFLMFLASLSLYLVVKGERMVGVVLLSLTLLVDFASSIVLLILLLLYLVHTKKNLRPVLYALASYVVVFVFSFFVLNFRIPRLLRAEHALPHLITDLGALIGYTAFLLILAAIGFIVAWKRKTDAILVNLLIIVLFFTSVYYPDLKVVSNFVFMVYAGHALTYLVERKWAISTIKTVTLLLVFCTLLYSASSYINRVSQLEPDPVLVQALDGIAKQSAEGSVLSSPENGFFIEFFAKRRAVVTSNTLNATLLNEARTMLMSRQLEPIQDLLDKHNVRYVFISPRMKTALWQGPEDGIQFLLKNSESFINVFNVNETESWIYLPE